MSEPKSTSLKELDKQLPYRLREQFMSTPELALFRVLQDMVQNRYIICPKVALNDVFYIVRPNENVHFFSKIFRKHVDFLLCEPETFKPEVGIELVKPVSRNETREADKFMEDLFLSARLPLVHVPSNDHYDENDLTELFKFSIAKIQNNVPLHASSEIDSAPMCPVCGRMMVLRIHRGGPENGKEYYGCMDSPKCSGVVEIK